MCFGFRFNRNEDVTLTETVLDASGNPRNLTGAKLWFEAAASYDATPIFTRKNTTAGGDDTQVEVLAQSGATLGQCVLKLPRTLTASLPSRAYDAAWWIEVGGVRALVKRVTMLVTKAVGEGVTG